MSEGELTIGIAILWMAAAFIVLAALRVAWERFTRDRAITFGARGFSIGGGNEYLLGEIRRIAAKREIPGNGLIEFGRKERAVLELLMTDGRVLTVHEGMPGFTEFVAGISAPGEIPAPVMDWLAHRDPLASWVVLFDRADLKPA